MWGGFHYFMDAAVGVLIGCLCSALGILLARVLAYDLPVRDESYTEQFRWSRDKQAAPLLDTGGRYIPVPTLTGAGELDDADVLPVSTKG